MTSTLRKLAVIVAFTCTAFTAQASLSGEESFEVNGKRVPRNVYDAAILFNESVQLVRSNCTERAVGKLRRAVLVAPDLPDARNGLAVLLARQGNLVEAKTHLLKAVSSPNAPNGAYLNLATLYQTTGDLDKAIANYEIYIARTNDKMTQAAVDLLRQERDRRAAAGGSNPTDDYLNQSNFHSRLRWSDARMPLKVFIDRPSSDLEGYQESYSNILRQSFYDWSKASNKKVRFSFVPKESAADIKCYFTNDPHYLGEGAEAGETRMKALGQAMLSADIYLRVKEEAGDFPYTDNAVKGTCLHEIGHALGISGHSLNVSDIMFFSTPFAEVDRQLSPRDIKTLCKLYSQPTDVNSSIVDFFFNPETYKKWGVIGLIGVAVLVLVGIALRATLNEAKKKKRKKPR